MKYNYYLANDSDAEGYLDKKLPTFFIEFIFYISFYFWNVMLLNVNNCWMKWLVFIII